MAYRLENGIPVGKFPNRYAIFHFHKVRQSLFGRNLAVVTTVPSVNYPSSSECVDDAGAAGSFRRKA